MNGVDALWVDHCLRQCARGPMGELALACRLAVARGDDDALLPMVRDIQPALIVFDFDYPDTRGLRALLRVRKEHAHIPVLMLVEPCYDGVLLWALRARVWDVLIKPVTAESLLQRMHWLRKAASVRVADGSRANAMPTPAVPMAARFAAKYAEQPRTAKACRYVEAHLHEKLCEAEVARCCGLSRSEFSRAFHEENGMTFRQYLLSARMNRALDMLKRTDAPITEIAFCVGFHDPSHFANRFRHHTGCSPSVFRERQRAAH